jgi:hypothetical protein
MFTATDWPLYCWSFPDLRLLIAHCTAGSISSRKSRKDQQYNGQSVAVNQERTSSTMVWPLYCWSFLDLRLLIDRCTAGLFLIYGYWLTIVLLVLSWFTATDWPLYCWSFLDLRLLIDHCTAGPFLIYGYWLTIVLLQSVAVNQERTSSTTVYQ